MRNWACTVGAGLCLLITSCQTAQIAKKVDFVAISSDVKPGKSAGLLKSESCGIRVAGFGSSPDIKIALARSNSRYINNFAIDRNYHDYYVFSKDCWTLSGEGFN